MLVERIRKLRPPAPRSAPSAASTWPKWRQSYAEYFFSYTEGPLLIVNASDLDFVGNPDDRRDSLEAIQNARAGTSHWTCGRLAQGAC